LWLNRSIVYRRLGRWSEAVQDATTALEHQPLDAKAHYGRAVALRHLGMMEAALSACGAGLDVQPDNKALVELRHVVMSLIPWGGHLKMVPSLRLASCGLTMWISGFGSLMEALLPAVLGRARHIRSVSGQLRRTCLWN